MSLGKPLFFDWALHVVQRGGRVCLDTVLPPHSLLNGQSLQGQSEETDPALWQHLQFLDAPWCEICGFPFEYDQGAGAICLHCHGQKPVFDRARAAINYDEVSSKLILDFKHGGRTDGLTFFAAQMARAGRDLLAGCDVLIPVPLHKKRLQARRFNQAALLARALSRRTGRPYTTDVLIRTKHTPPQGSNRAPARRKNVAGAFKILQGETLKGRHIVLIDDVYTTGATLNACARVLKRAGARQIDALSLLRVVRPLEFQK